MREGEGIDFPGEIPIDIDLSIVKEEVPDEIPIDIDLSLVKEEAIGIEELNEFPWPEAISEDAVNVKTEEEGKEHGQPPIYQPEVGEELQNFAVPLLITTGKQRTRKQRRKRRGATRVSTTRVSRTRVSTTGPKKHWCSICNCKQESPRALALHRLQFHPNDARYNCSYCPRVFFHHSNRRKHELTHLGPVPRMQCTMCTKTFSRKNGLLAHVRAVHTGERPFVCQHCGMTFARDFCYRTHMYIHLNNRPYVCEECNKSFYSNSDLVKHRRLHTGEKPYSCDKCPKTFRVRGQLNQHRAIHTGERPLPCGLCSKTFRRGTNVALHRERHIVDATMMKKHKCDVCNREFSRQGNLKVHMKRHSPVKSAKCRYCNRAFKTNGDLAKHENLHTREKIYICDTCGKNFMRKGRLRIHIHTFHLSPQHPKRPTICRACGVNYKFPSRLKIHQKNKKCREYLRKLKKNGITA